MKQFTRYFVGASLLLSLGASAGTANAQKRLRTSEMNLEEFNYKLGNIYYTPSFKAAFGYDSNSNNSTSSDKDNGYYSEAALGLDFFYEPFRGLRLDTDFYIGYREAFGNNGTSGLILGSDNGDATFGFDYDISEKTTFSIENRATVGMEKIADARTNENSDSRQFWDNDLGTQIHRDITDDTGIAFKLGYRTRRDLKDNSPTEEYDESYFGITLDHSVNAKLSLNPFFNYEDREWTENDFNNDVETLEYGIQAEYLISDQVNLNLTVAYKELDFDDTAILASRSDSKEDGFVGSFSVTHTATEKFSHTVSGSFDTAPTTVAIANASDEMQLGYSANYTVNEKLSVSAGFDMFRGEDQGNTRIDETYYIYTPSVGAAYKITPRQTLDFKCSYQHKDSDQADGVGNANEYERTTVDFNYTYTF